MKKVFMLLAVALMSIGAYAQDSEKDLTTFIFVDKNGNEVKDGAVVTVTDAEMKEGRLQVSTGLFVKNTTNQSQGVGLDLEVKQIDNGSFSCCFPANCQDFSNVGVYNDANAPTIMEAGETKDFQTEWFPSAYGTSVATFQLKKYSVTTNSIFGMTIEAVGDFISYAPKITINFVYGDPTSVKGITDNSNATVVARYNAAGMRANTQVKGLNIEKLSNGKTIKRIVK